MVYNAQLVVVIQCFCREDQGVKRWVLLFLTEFYLEIESDAVNLLSSKQKLSKMLHMSRSVVAVTRVETLPCGSQVG